MDSKNKPMNLSMFDQSLTARIEFKKSGNDILDKKLVTSPKVVKQAPAPMPAAIKVPEKVAQPQKAPMIPKVTEPIAQSKVETPKKKVPVANDPFQSVKPNVSLAAAPIKPESTVPAQDPFKQVAAKLPQTQLPSATTNIFGKAMAGNSSFGGPSAADLAAAAKQPTAPKQTFGTSFGQNATQPSSFSSGPSAGPSSFSAFSSSSAPGAFGGAPGSAPGAFGGAPSSAPGAFGGAPNSAPGAFGGAPKPAAGSPFSMLGGNNSAPGGIFGGGGAAQPSTGIFGGPPKPAGGPGPAPVFGANPNAGPAGVFGGGNAGAMFGGGAPASNVFGGGGGAANGFAAAPIMGGSSGMMTKMRK